MKEIFGANINFNQPFLEAGLDSLSAVELRDAVEAAIEIELPSTVVFDYPSVAAISDFIVSQMHPEAEALDDNGITGHKPIVTYGDNAARCVMLGVVDSQFEEARFESFVGDVEMFDSDLFNVSTSEAVLMDPQQRMLLEAAWEAKAGVPGDIPPDRAGVIVGISGSEYGQMTNVVSAHTAKGGALSVACGCVSYTFGLRGIRLSVDTASSSSLVAAHIAITSV